MYRVGFAWIRRTSDNFALFISLSFRFMDFGDGAIYGGRALTTSIFFCIFNELMFDTKLFSNPFIRSRIDGLTVILECLVLIIRICNFVVLARAAGIGAILTLKSVLIKCSLEAIRALRGGILTMRGGTGGDAGGASKLHELFVADESLASI